MRSKFFPYRLVFLASLVAWHIFAAGAASAQNQYTISTPARTAQTGDTLYGITADNSGNVLFVQEGTPLILKFNPYAAPGSAPTLFVGNTPYNWNTCGPGWATNIGLDGPIGIASDNLGNYYLTQLCDVFRVSFVNGVWQLYQVTTDGHGYLAVAADRFGNVFISSQAGEHIVREVPAGTSQPFDGNPVAGQEYQDACNNLPSSLIPGRIGTPTGLAVDYDGNLFIADQECDVIWKVAPGQSPAVYAGIAGKPGSGDGPTTGPNAALLNQPKGLAVDLHGNVYIADWGNNQIREVSNGTVTTVANLNGVAGESGDGGAAMNAELDGPYGITVGPGGILFVTDQGTSVTGDVPSVRQLTPAGAQIALPPPGSTLTSTSVTFGWNAWPGATGYSLTLGTAPGKSDIYANASIPASTTSLQVASIPYNSQTIYADLQTELPGSSTLDPGIVVYTAPAELKLALTPAALLPDKTFNAQVTINHFVEGLFTLSLALNYPPSCHEIWVGIGLAGHYVTVCEPGFSDVVYTSPAFWLEPSCPIFFPPSAPPCLEFPYYNVTLTAPSGIGSYSVTASLIPAGSTTPIAWATQPLTVQ